MPLEPEHVIGGQQGLISQLLFNLVLRSLRGMKLNCIWAYRRRHPITKFLLQVISHVTNTVAGITNESSSSAAPPPEGEGGGLTRDVCVSVIIQRIR
jgi:hypothetical protein